VAGQATVVSDITLSGEDIRTYLNEVAETLPAGTRHMLVMVGGSLLAWHGLRASTYDVDSVLALDEALREAVAQVAQSRHLARQWLNDRARPFAPQTLRQQDCEVLLDHPALLVLGAPLGQVFLMKLDASRVRSSDVEDMITLWPHCGFTSPQDVVDQYYEAYPLASPDEYLAEYVEDIAAASGQDAGT
jgi:hypothetical protein